MATPKQSWPELIGKTGEEAEKQILKERPGLEVYIIAPPHDVDRDWCLNRIHLFVDENNKVIYPVEIG